MTTSLDPQAILELVKNLMDRYEVRTILTETRMTNMFAVYEHFPDIAQSYISLHERMKIAEEALEKIKETSNPVPQGLCCCDCGVDHMKEVNDFAKEALSFDPLSSSPL